MEWVTTHKESITLEGPGTLDSLPVRSSLEYSGHHLIRRAFTNYSLFKEETKPKRGLGSRKIEGEGGEGSLRAFLSERKWPCPIGPQRQHHGVRFQLGDERTSAENTVSGLKLGAPPHQDF